MNIEVKIVKNILLLLSVYVMVKKSTNFILLSLDHANLLKHKYNNSENRMVTKMSKIRTYVLYVELKNVKNWDILPILSATGKNKDSFFSYSFNHGKFNTQRYNNAENRNGNKMSKWTVEV